MSVPPPPNQWGPQPPTGGQPVGDVPQWGPPPGGQPGGAPQWGPPPGPPPRGGGKGKWIFGGIAVIAVIAVTVVITVLVVGKDSASSPSPTSTSTAGPTSDIASANDKGPATIITEDPTCASTRPILDALASQERNGWDKRDPSVPASAWTPAVRAQFEAVGQAMRTAADQMVALAKLTPDRVMRELYEQNIAYSRAYADRIPTYTPLDDNLALAAIAAGNSIGDICAAIGYQSAPARGPLMPVPATPSQVAPPGNPEDPQRFLPGPNPVCAEWSTVLDDFQRDTADWLSIPSDIPASGWTPEQRAINDAVAPVMEASADRLQALGERSGNLTLQDFALLSAQYRRAYAESLPTYIAADNFLSEAGTALTGIVQAACKATTA
jgi:hypothetical protein